MRLLEDPNLTHDINPLFLQFILLLCYRFGLRTKEAIGIKRCDWMVEGSQRFVVVNNNRFRRLKTFSSRRVIPLLFELEPYEKEIIEKIETYHLTVAGNNTSTYMMSYISEASLEITRHNLSISNTLINVLRIITKNPKIVLHHCRHTFYNRIGIILLNLDSISPIKFYAKSDKDLAASIVLLGCKNSNSKRTASALALTMGHYYSKTGFKSYFHLMTEWLDSLAPIEAGRLRKVPVDLDLDNDALLSENEILSHYKTNVIFQPISPYVLSQLFRLISLNKSFDISSKKLNIDPVKVGLIEKFYLKICSNMRLHSRDSSHGWVKANNDPFLFLEKISDRAWLKIIDFFNEIDLAFFKASIQSFKGQDFSAMLSRHRQILIADSTQLDFFNYFITLLNVPLSLFKFVAVNDNEYFTNLLNKYSFPVDPAKEYQVDPYLYVDKGFESRRKDYLAVFFQRNQSFFIRNRYELALFFVIISTCVMLFDCDRKHCDISFT